MFYLRGSHTGQWPPRVTKSFFKAQTELKFEVRFESFDLLGHRVASEADLASCLLIQYVNGLTTV